MSGDILARQVVTPALVYLRGMRGQAEAQIWWQPIPDFDGNYRGRILAWHPLDGGIAGVPLDVLIEIYPPPTYVRASD